MKVSDCAHLINAYPRLSDFHFGKLVAKERINTELHVAASFGVVEKHHEEHEVVAYCGKFEATIAEILVEAEYGTVIDVFGKQLLSEMFAYHTPDVAIPGGCSLLDVGFLHILLVDAFEGTMLVVPGVLELEHQFGASQAVDVVEFIKSRLIALEEASDFYVEHGGVGSFDHGALFELLGRVQDDVCYDVASLAVVSDRDSYFVSAALDLFGLEHYCVQKSHNFGQFSGNKIAKRVVFELSERLKTCRL